MTFDPNDPRLTAYVLGELDPSERPEIEAMLETTAEGRQAVEEIRRTVGWLTEQLCDEQAAHTVTPETNHRPLAVLSTPTPAAPRRPWWRMAPVRLGAAAAVLLIGAMVFLVSFQTVPPAAPRAAMNPAKLRILADRSRSAAPTGTDA